MNRKLKKTEDGFTLIEMIVSLALFSVVVTVSVGALLMLIGTNDRLQGEQAVMTNLSFALDSMTREIRTGTNYYCLSASSATGIFDDNSSSHEGLNDSVRDCPNGNSSSANYHGVSFKEAGDSITEGSADRILYYFNKAEGKIYRRIGDNDAESIVSSGIFIEKADFFVTGGPAVDPSFNTVQPTVSIHIQAIDANDAAVDKKSYFVQTTVTQRTLDI